MYPLELPANGFGSGPAAGYRVSTKDLGAVSSQLPYSYAVGGKRRKHAYEKDQNGSEAEEDEENEGSDESESESDAHSGYRGVTAKAPVVGTPSSSSGKHATASGPASGKKRSPGAMLAEAAQSLPAASGEDTHKNMPMHLPMHMLGHSSAQPLRMLDHQRSATSFGGKLHVLPFVGDHHPVTDISMAQLFSNSADWWNSAQAGLRHQRALQGESAAEPQQQQQQQQQQLREMKRQRKAAQLRLEYEQAFVDALCSQGQEFWEDARGFRVPRTGISVKKQGRLFGGREGGSANGNVDGENPVQQSSGFVFPPVDPRDRDERGGGEGTGYNYEYSGLARIRASSVRSEEAVHRSEPRIFGTDSTAPNLADAASRASASASSKSLSGESGLSWASAARAVDGAALAAETTGAIEADDEEGDEEDNMSVFDGSMSSLGVGVRADAGTGAGAVEEDNPLLSCADPELPPAPLLQFVLKLANAKAANRAGGSGSGGASAGDSGVSQGTELGLGLGLALGAAPAAWMDRMDASALVAVAVLLEELVRDQAVSWGRTGAPLPFSARALRTEVFAQLNGVSDPSAVPTALLQNRLEVRGLLVK
jgi:hypothetical protein